MSRAEDLPPVGAPVDRALALEIAMATLAAELACTRGDLVSGRAHFVTRPEDHDHPLIRRYPKRAPFFSAVTFGTGGVVSAPAQVMETIHSELGGVLPGELFDPVALGVYGRLLEPHGLRVYGPFPRLLCGVDTWRECAVPDGIEISVEIEPGLDRIDAFEPDRWPNSLRYRHRPSREQRPTMAMVLAHRGSELVGAASAAEDSSRIWQIGIDVDAKSQARGIGPALTSRLTAHILEQGRVPLWGAHPANLPSIRTALAAGFEPRWIEVLRAPVSG